MTAAELDEKVRRVLTDGIDHLNFFRACRTTGRVPGTSSHYPLGDNEEVSAFTDVFVTVQEIIRDLQEATNGK